MSELETIEFNRLIKSTTFGITAPQITYYYPHQIVDEVEIDYSDIKKPSKVMQELIGSKVDVSTNGVLRIKF